MPVSFAVSRQEDEVIWQIVDRAEAMARPQWGVEFDRHGAAMDLTATHANGCPLRLDALLAAEPVDFAHDVFGIFRHIDRNTGQLRDYFTPRYAVPENPLPLLRGARPS